MTGDSSQGVRRLDVRRWPGEIGRAGVKLIDAILIRRHHLLTFAQDPDCVLRIGPEVLTLAEPVMLSDGSRFEAGERLIEIHFWNEHLPRLPEGGADIRWAIEFVRTLSYSLTLLSAYLNTHPRYAEWAALRGRLAFIPASQVAERKRLSGHLGFVLEVREAPGLRFWEGAFWEALYSWWLMWAFNPVTLEDKRFRDSALSELWMTRRTLESRYGAGGTAAREPVSEFSG